MPLKAINRKADANMWWIIIGAALALLVLVVLSVFFTSKTTTVNENILSCEGKGSGSCVPLNSCQGSISTTFQCPPTQECCFAPKRSKGEICATTKECRIGLQCKEGLCQ